MQPVHLLSVGLPDVSMAVLLMRMDVKHVAAEALLVSGTCWMQTAYG